MQLIYRSRAIEFNTSFAYRTIAQQYLIRQQFEPGLFGITAIAFSVPVTRI